MCDVRKAGRSSFHARVQPLRTATVRRMCSAQQRPVRRLCAEREGPVRTVGVHYAPTTRSLTKVKEENFLDLCLRPFAGKIKRANRLPVRDQVRNATGAPARKSWMRRQIGTEMHSKKPFNCNDNARKGGGTAKQTEKHGRSVGEPAVERRQAGRLP